jgi:uncharacterized membrane protein
MLLLLFLNNFYSFIWLYKYLNKAKKQINKKPITMSQKDQKISNHKTTIGKKLRIYKNLKE